MALVVLGKTRCNLCGELHLPGQNLVLFPANMFVSVNDPFHRFRDAGVHESCLRAFPGGDIALEMVYAYLEE